MQLKINTNLRAEKVDPASLPKGSIPFEQTQHCQILNENGTRYFYVTSVTLQLNAQEQKGFQYLRGMWTCYRRNYFHVSTKLALKTTDKQASTGPHYICGSHAHFTGVTENIELVTKEGLRDKKALSNKVSSNSDDQLTEHTSIKTRTNWTETHPCSFQHKISTYFVQLRSETTFKDTKDIYPPLILRYNSKREKQECLVDQWAYIKPTTDSQESLVEFKRLQFKRSTVGNDLRTPAAQEYFRLAIDLFAITTDGFTVKVATTQSDFIVARGRPPTHYAKLDGDWVKSGRDLQHSVSPMVSASPYSAVSTVSNSGFDNLPSATTPKSARFNKLFWQKQIDLALETADLASGIPSAAAFGSSPLISPTIKSASLNPMLNSFSSMYSAYDNISHHAQNANEFCFNVTKISPDYTQSLLGGNFPNVVSPLERTSHPPFPLNMNFDAGTNSPLSVAPDSPWQPNIVNADEFITDFLSGLP